MRNLSIILAAAFLAACGGSVTRSVQVDGLGKPHRSLTSDDIKALECHELAHWINARERHVRSSVVISLPALYKLVQTELGALQDEYAIRCGDAES